MWRCRTCGETHGDLPMAYSFDAPWRLVGVPDEERAGRAEATDEICIVDDALFLVRGQIEIPVVEPPEDTFVWSVWCSLSETSFTRFYSRLRALDRGSDPPYLGWLVCELPTYPETLNLKVVLRSRPLGALPRVLLEPNAHPLAVEQRHGIDWLRVEELAHAILGAGGATF